MLITLGNVHNTTIVEWSYREYTVGYTMKIQEDKNPARTRDKGREYLRNQGNQNER